jgi:hypothetical protein
MRYEIISEGATLVHAVDIAGRAALSKSLDALMMGVWKQFCPNGYDEENPDQQGNDYDRMYKHYFDDSPSRKELIDHICTTASKALTGVIQSDLLTRFGESVPWKIAGYGEIDLRTSGIKVQLTVRPTEGDDAKYLGFFMPSHENSYIKVHCDEEKLLTSAMASVMSQAFGDGEGRDDLVNSIAPTFAHEYSHLIQYIAAKGYHAFQSGITTVGGGRKTPRQGDSTITGWWRYIGSNAEIDSWATSVASQIIARINRYSYSGEMDNEQIDYGMESAATGYADSESYRTYIQYYQSALAGDYDKIGLSKQEATKVWQRFLKTVHAKLAAYKKPAFGKSKSGYTRFKYDPQWTKWAKKGLSYCASRLADIVAFECSEQSYKAYDGSWRIEPHHTIDKAESFIHTYFFNEDYDFDKQMKISNAFKALVVRRLPDYQQREAA